jgi:hypothetical protein
MAGAGSGWVYVAVEMESFMRRFLQWRIPFGTVCALALFSPVLPVQAYIAPSSFFDVFLDSSQGPPYPPANPVRTSFGTPSLPFTTIGKIATQVKSVTPVVQTRMIGSDSGGSVGNPGLCSFFDVFLDAPTMPSSFFDIFTELTSSVGGALPLADAPTVIWHTDSFFDVFLEADIPGKGRQFLQMSFRVPDGQPVKFTPGPTVSYAAPSSFFDVFLQAFSTAGGQIVPTLPVFRVVMTGSLGWPQPWPTPGTVTKFRQNPDISVRGLDVLDGWITNNGPATLLADDFFCNRTGPINEIQIWGSWLNNQADNWPTFWVGIWSDTPSLGNQPSHPDQLLWWQQFYPGQYRASAQQTVPFEQVLDPNQPPKILGPDTQIWKYDFFPQTPFRQLGTPQQPKVYWMSVVAKTTAGKVFGWKTTADHYNDYAVYSPTVFTGLKGYPMPGAVWQVIKEPQGRKRELSFMLNTAQTWACNKDFWNPGTTIYNDVRVVLPGSWGIGNSFTGFGGIYPQFANFNWDWDAVGQTTLDWSAGTVAPGQWVHVGFEGPGPLPPFLNWGWWNPYLMTWSGWIPQVSIGWQGLLQPTPRIGLTNILPIVPGLTNNVFVSGLSLEYYTDAVPLDSLNRFATRTPIRTDSGFSIPSPMVTPQQDLQIDVPLPPRLATYAVVIPQISPVSSQGVPNPQFASVDWAMLPLTEPETLPPPPQPVLQMPSITGTDVTLTWTAEPGYVYRLQSKTVLPGADWTDAEGDVVAGDTLASKTVAVGGAAAFYRVQALVP